MVKNRLEMQGTWVLSLVQELRSHMPQGNKALEPQTREAPVPQRMILKPNKYSTNNLLLNNSSSFLTPQVLCAVLSCSNTSYSL